MRRENATDWLRARGAVTIALPFRGFAFARSLGYTLLARPVRASEIFSGRGSHAPERLTIKSARGKLIDLALFR